MRKIFNRSDAPYFLSIIAAILSVISLCLSFIKIQPVEWNLVGILCGVLSFFVAVIIFFLGFNYITYEKKMRKETTQALNESQEDIIRAVEAYYMSIYERSNYVINFSGHIKGCLNGLVHEQKSKKKYATDKLISSLQSLINEHMEDLSGLKMTDEEKKGYLTVLYSLKKEGKNTDKIIEAITSITSITIQETDKKMP